MSCHVLVWPKESFLLDGHEERHIARSMLSRDPSEHTGVLFHTAEFSWLQYSSVDICGKHSVVDPPNLR